MRRISLALVTALALAGCGGGGGGTMPPVSTVSKAPSVVSFVLKVPVKAKQVRGYVRRANGSMYVSPATLGAGINFASGANATFSASQLEAPNVSFDLSACGTGCTANSDGSYTYTIQASVPPGTYTFAVTTWDGAPNAGSFSPTLAMLSEAYVANQTILAGSTSTSLPLTLNGIPKSVNFTPLPAQSHLEQVTGGYSIIGNAPVQFIANALDADGYVIAGSGAPTFTATDSTGSFTFTESGTSNVYSVQAKNSTAANQTVSVSLAATPPTGSGLTAASGTINLSPTPELWWTLGGSGSSVFIGYPLTGASYAIGQQIDYVNSTFTNLAQLTADSAGNLWMVDGSQVQEFNASSNSTPPTVNSNYIQQGSPNGIAVDANGLLWVTDVNLPSGYHEIVAYNPNNLGTQVYQMTAQNSGPPPARHRPFVGSLPELGSPAIAPSTSAIPSALAGSIWLPGNSGLDVLTVSGGSLHDTYPAVLAAPLEGVTIGPDGTVWTYDGTTLSAYSLTFTTTPTLTPEASYSVSYGSNEMATDPAGNLWMSNPENGDIEEYALSGCPASCSITEVNSSYGPDVSWTVSGVTITP